MTREKFPKVRSKKKTDKKKTVLPGAGISDERYGHWREVHSQRGKAVTGDDLTGGNGNY